MLRDYRSEDLEAVTAAIQAGIDMSAKKIASYIDSYSALVHDDGGIQGVAVYNSPEDGDGAADVWIYTHPDARRRGLGGRMWEELQERLQPAPQRIDTFYRVDVGDGGEFFRRRGFEHWFTLVDSIYDGPGFPEPAELQVHQYEDRFLADYALIINESFYDLRKEHDIEPYTIYPRASLDSPDTRRRISDNARNTFIFTVEGTVVGLGALEDPVHGDGNGVDVVAVKPEYRRRGYGRLITGFCINRVRERGFEDVYIAFMRSNTPARRLYEGMGCRPTAVYDEARLFARDPHKQRDCRG